MDSHNQILGEMILSDINDYKRFIIKIGIFFIFLINGIFSNIDRSFTKIVNQNRIIY